MAIDAVMIGARGHTGSELVPLLHHHPEIELRAVGSSSVKGEPLNKHINGVDDCNLLFSDIQPDNVAEIPAALFVLALSNGQAARYVAAIEHHHPQAVIVDLSADYRFDDTWVYGQPERFGDRLRGAKRIANPGCYATGAQLALAPLIDRVRATPVVFGVSGFSGAGNTPSRRNDRTVLKDNILPYSLVDHVHEQEVSRHLKRDVRLLPHVADFFRGISLTVAVELEPALRQEAVYELFVETYAPSPLIEIRHDVPEVADVRHKHGVIIGGFAISHVSPTHLSYVCVLDNLLKGAATQAIQNINLAFGFPSLAGLQLQDREQRNKRDE